MTLLRYSIFIETLMCGLLVLCKVETIAIYCHWGDPHCGFPRGGINCE